MAYKQRNNPFNRPATSSLNMSSAFKVDDPKLGDPTSDEELVAEMELSRPETRRDTRGEMTEYNVKGEVVEEGDEYVGGTYDAYGDLSAEDNLLMAATNMENAFIDPENPTNEDGSINYLTEGMAPQKDYIENTLFADVGYDGDSKGDPWSAAAVSNLAQAFDPDFKGSAQHAQYINRAFQGEGNYYPTKLNRRNRKDLHVGDILFKGRSDGPQNYKDFKNAAKDGWNDQNPSAGYKSHSDIIVDSYEKGGVTYYTVQGGNVGDTITKKDYTAKQLEDMYAGRLTQ